MTQLNCGEFVKTDIEAAAHLNTVHFAKYDETNQEIKICLSGKIPMKQFK